VTEAEWNFLIRGAAGVESGRSKKPGEAYFINTHQWESICDLENSFPVFQDFSKTALKEIVKIHIGGFKYVRLVTVNI